MYILIPLNEFEIFTHIPICSLGVVEGSYESSHFVLSSNRKIGSIEGLLNFLSHTLISYVQLTIFSHIRTIYSADHIMTSTFN